MIVIGICIGAIATALVGIMFCLFTMSARAGCDQEAGANRILKALVTFEEKVMPAIDDIRAQVARETTVTASAVTLLQQIKAALDAALLAGDQAALQQLANDLGVQVDALAAAVTANTPTPPGDGGGE